MLKFNRAYLSPLIVLAGAIGFLSFGSYAEGEETRNIMSALSIDKTISFEDLNVHMQGEGYIIIEERRIGGGFGKEERTICGPAEVGQKVFESRNPDADKVMFNFGYRMTATGCELRINDVRKF